MEKIKENLWTRVRRMENLGIEFADKNNFILWMFEYGCQYAELENKTAKNNVDYCDQVIVQKIDYIIEETLKIYNSVPYLEKLRLQKLDFKDIPSSVRADHGLKDELVNKLREEYG